MNALVTGGAGFIGSHLVDALMARGDKVYVLDDLSVGKGSNLALYAHDPNLQLFKGSILDEDLVDFLTGLADVVFHLAAVVGVKYVLEDPYHAMLTNIRGTENVLAAAHRYGVRAVIASSSEVYGKSVEVPLSEDADRLLGPTTVNRWSYSASKAIDEYVALARAREGLPVSIVRYFNVYGPRMDPRGYGSVIAKFISQARRGGPLTVYGDGEQTRCFTYVADAVEGTILASGPVATGKIFNIGDTDEITINELACMIARLTGSQSETRHVPYEPGFEETRRRVPDIQRAETVLGFHASTPFEQGLLATIRSME